MNKYLPALVCGFSSGVLLAVPIFKEAACCLIVPGAVILALALYKRANKIEGKISYKESAIIGILTGVYAAAFGSVFELLITFITKTNSIVDNIPQIEEVLKEYSQLPIVDEMIRMYRQMAQDISETGFSTLFAFSILFNNFITQSILGLLAGLAGVKFINRTIPSDKNKNEDQ